MSHFSVAVITDKLEKVEEMLAPYSENIRVKPYIDETKEEIINNAKQIRERAEKENEPYEEYNKESRAYWINQGRISLEKKLLEDK